MKTDEMNEIGIDILHNQHLVGEIIDEFAPAIGNSFWRYKKILGLDTREDYEQSVRLYLVQKIPDFDPHRWFDFTPYILNMIHLAGRKFVEREMRYRTRVKLMADPPTRGVDGPENEIINKLTLPQLLANAGLTAKQKEVMELFETKNTTQIGHVLDTSVSLICERRKAARRKLKNHVEKGDLL